MKPIMTAQEVAELLYCSVKTVENHARAGSIPATKFGDGWVFSSELVIEAVKAISQQEAAERAKPQRKAKGYKVMENAKPKPPGMKHLSEEAIRQILTPQ
jgi:excisionase family DNA binding protein